MSAKPPVPASAFAAGLADKMGHGVMIAFVKDDGSGSGVFVELGYASLTIEDAEFMVGTLLRDLKLQLTGPDSHDCDVCRRRRARISDALSALERDGATPTGLTPATLKH